MTPLVIIAGPTAVGKSALSIDLAKRINAEIISADSMQVYKGMDIGSAKITKEEMQGVPHHLIDILDPTKDFSVADFKDLAKKAASDIYKRGKIPMLVGGTGFYIQSLLYDVDFDESSGKVSSYRETLEKEYDELGPDAMFERLKQVDPDYCEIIHKNDKKRVVRALEFYLDTKTPISKHNVTEMQKEPVYNAGFFVLTDDREKIYKRINERVDVMVKSGLVDEVMKLKDLGLTKEDVSMHGLGYKEILMYLDNEISLDEAIYMIKRDSRHFAKRQLTWFKRERNVTWVSIDKFDYNKEKILDFICEELRNKNIII
jgi:tRNA dimethylallyltransferase